ncbi:MAG TPA: hypothetical protein VK674_06665 [Candidatus Limnocylindria bacterium]|nr:hypothetical protein [Candidatus Limnocylindria bacterium]
MALTRHPTLGIAGAVSSNGSPEYAASRAPGPPPDPFRSVVIPHDETTRTISLIDRTQAAYWPISDMPDVLEIQPKPQSQGTSEKPELCLVSREGVVARALLLEQVEPVPFDRTTMTVDDVTEAMGNQQLRPILKVYFADGRRLPGPLAEESYGNSPDFNPATFGTGISTRTVHIGTEHHFPLPEPFPPRRPGEGMAVVGPPKDSGQDLTIGLLLYDGQGDFMVRGLSPEVVDCMTKEEVAAGFWVGINPEGTVGLLGRDNYLDPQQDPEGLVGPIILVETTKPFTSIEKSPLRTRAALEQLGKLGLLASAAPSVPDAEPPPAAVLPDAELDLPDLVEASVSRDSPHAILDEQRDNGYVTVTTNGPGWFGRRKAKSTSGFVV